MTRTGLTDMQAPSTQAAQRLNALESTLARMLDIANKELLNQPLTRDDETYLDGLPGALESLVTGVAATGLKTTLVADVHTNIVEEMVLEEAVGKVDLIVVACPGIGGSVFLAAGRVDAVTDSRVCISGAAVHVFLVRRATSHMPNTVAGIDASRIV